MNPALVLALRCGAARFYPEAQAERDDAYLVGQQFLERYYAAARADLDAAIERKDALLRQVLSAYEQDEGLAMGRVVDAITKELAK